MPSAASSTPTAGPQKPKLRLRWSTILGIAIIHLGCIFAWHTFTWSGLAIGVFLAWLSTGVGVCLGYHRLLTHRSFQTPKWMEYLITGCACLSWQGGPIFWAGTHRMHHADSDQPGDPHTPHDGVIWSHMTWCMVEDLLGRDPADYAKDLARDPFHRFVDKWFAIPQIVLAVGLLLLGYQLGGWSLGLSWLVWGIAVRTTWVYHISWMTNSAGHLWGYRNFDTTDDSRNNWFVGLMAMGEGWHNNHHAYQRSAAHGMRWWELDLTYRTIQLLELVGLAKKVVLPAPEIMSGKQRQPNRAAVAAESLVDKSLTMSEPQAAV